MDNQIQPHYVTFEQAKWLKEKGFNTKVISFFDNDKLSEPKDRKVDGFTIYNPINWNTVKPHYYSRPEQHQVVEWLQVNYDICIYIKPYADRKTFQPFWVFMNEKSKVSTSEFHLSGNASIAGSDYKTRQEAYSAAFDYILNNLI
jgi:hypothetical protein